LEQTNNQNLLEMVITPDSFQKLVKELQKESTAKYETSKDI